MGDIDILVYDYWEATIIKIITIIALTISALNTVYKSVKLSTNVSIKCYDISANYHDITRLLLVTIIVSSKNWTISIIDKELIGKTG